MSNTLPVSVLNTLPCPEAAEVDRLLAAELDASRLKLVVLDDDPTGVQTVHDLSVYTDWSEDSIRRGFAEENRAFYILTNSRGMTVAETTSAHREIGARVAAVSRDTGIPYLIFSRSDSTLRGHFPLETELLREESEKAGLPVDGEILCPFFLEGGRFTLGNVHYVRQGETLVPAADTEFARDKTFGYSHSDLPSYIEEKTRGAYPAESVTCISLEDLRSMNLDAIETQLLAVEGFGKVAVNAASYSDVKVFAIALYRALAKGKRFLFRTAAGLVKVMAGVSDQPLLTHAQLIPDASALGGLVVVGSHTAKTTAQLKELLTLPETVEIPFNSDKVLEGDEALAAEVARCIALEEEVIRSGKTAVCYTSRTLLSLPDDTPEAALVRSVKISDSVQKLVAGLSIRPAFVIAKGGITSSDVGTKALAVKRAEVLGQIQPGIPVWRCGSESKFPGISYVIFPGNVGEADTLRKAAEVLIRG